MGDRIVVVALALFVVDDLGGASQLGIVLTAHAVPFLAFLLVGGVWADRLPRQRLMMGTDLVRAALHGILAALILTGNARLWNVVVIEVLFGTADAFFRPAFTGLLPQTVPRSLIQPANALSSASDNLAEFAGPALATALVVGVGAGWAFAVDAATFVVSAVFLLRVRPLRPAEPGPRSSLLAELREGYRHVRRRPWVWVTIAAFSGALLVGLAPFYVLGPVIAEDQYGTASFYGLISAAFGAGAMLGAAAGLRWRPQRPMLLGLLACAPWPVMMATYAVGAPVALVAPVAGATGIGLALFDIWWATALAERIPAGALSRVSAYDWMGSLAFLPIGYLLAGPAAALLGASTVLAVGAGLTALALAAGLLPRETRQLRADSP